MVEKADPGRNVAHTGAVEINAAGDLSFLRIAFDRRHPHRMFLLTACREHRLFSDFAVKLPLFAARLDREPAAPTCPVNASAVVAACF
jgi:hypothetical protein